MATVLMALLKETFDMVCSALQMHGIDYIMAETVLKGIRSMCDTPELIFRALLELVLSFHGFNLQRREFFLEKQYTLSDLIFFIENDLESVGFPFVLTKSLRNLDSYEKLDEEAMLSAIFYMLSIDNRFLGILSKKYGVVESTKLLPPHIESGTELEHSISHIHMLVNEAEGLLLCHNFEKTNAAEYRASLILETFYSTLESLMEELKTGRGYRSFCRFTGNFANFRFCAEPLFIVDDLAPIVDFTELNRKLASRIGREELLLETIGRDLAEQMKHLGYFNKKTLSFEATQ